MDGNLTDLKFDLNALDQIGLENVRYDIFFRNHIVRRVSDVTKISLLENLVELPIYSCLHVMDNFNLDRDITLVPDMTNPIMMLKPNRKMIYHLTHLENQTPLEFTDKGVILQNTGVNAALQAFRSEQSRMCKVVQALQDLPNTRSDIQAVVSYNSLFRAKLFGVKRRVKLMNFLLTNLVNTLAKLPDRQHFIHIPLTSLQFSRSHFLRAFKQLNNQAYIFPENMHYLFLVHFLSFIESTSTSSFFEHIPEMMLDKVNIIFQIKEKYVIYNLKTLRELNGDHNQILLRVIAQINTLAANGVEVLEDAETTADVATAEVLPIAEPGLLNIELPEDKLNIPEFVTPITHEEHKQFDVSEVNHIAMAADRIIDQLKQIPVSPHDKSMAAPIIKNTTYSPAQLTRIKQLGDAYQSISLGGKTIPELLLKSEPDTISDKPLNFLSNMLEDKSMINSSITEFDSDYMKKTYHKDLAKVLLSFNNHGMFLTNVEEHSVADDLNRSKTYKVSFEDINHKTHMIKFTLPDVDENGNCLVNGTLKVFKKQRVSNPICKVSPTRVTLNSNYNKYLVERNTNVAHSFYPYLMNFLSKQPATAYHLVYGACDTKKYVLPYEFTNIAQKLAAIHIGDTHFHFDFHIRYEGLSEEQKTIVTDIEKSNGICFGTNLKTHMAYFMRLDGTVTGVNYEETKTEYTGTLIDLLGDLFNTTPAPLNEWVDFKLLNKSVPLIFALAYRFGLTNILHYINTDYQLQDVGTRIERKASDTVIKFADKRLIIHRTPMFVSLIVNGLNHFDLSSTLIESMDSRDVYYDLIQSKKMNINYLKGIDSFFELFIDPITKDVLHQMHEPTNTKDLLLRAVQLLTTEEHKPASSCANFRIRSYEQLIATVYNEMARAYSTYKYQAIGATHRFSMSEYIIKQRILQAQLMENVDTINPINDIKYNCAFSHVGSGGRCAETFRIEDRKFPEDGVGIISEATVDNGKVALNAQLSMNPTIVNTRGMAISKSLEDLKPSEMLSVTSLLMPFITYDDKLIKYYLGY